MTAEAFVDALLQSMQVVGSRYERSALESNQHILEQSLRWILHHLIDHEAQHKGQALMLERLPG